MKQRTVLFTAILIAALLIGSLCSIAFAQQQSFLPLVHGGGNTATATPTTQPTPQPTATAVSSTCPTDTFIDVQAHPANAAYAAPELNVSCTTTELVIETNNIPNFEFVQITPNRLQAQDYTFHLPLQPVRSATTTSVPLGGSSAVTVNGLVIFGPTEAPQDGYRDPYLDGILDYCNGHTAQRGDYHFHARPECIYADLDQPVAKNVGLIIGYAFDGYPILAPYVCADTACTSIKELQSSWQDTNPTLSNAWERHEYVAGAGDLDECNGLEQADGSYAYYATDTFPYFMGCYRGVVTQQTTGVGGAPAQTTAAATTQSSSVQSSSLSGDMPSAMQAPRPDLAAAAATLGVTEEALRVALGDPRQGPPNLAVAAAQLGVTEQAIIAALGVSPSGPNGRGGRRP